jgi:ornithine--oxo-acid transaminase
MRVIIEEDLTEKARRLGRQLKYDLERIQDPVIREIRGRGLLVGIELSVPARPYCERLMKSGVLCKETHERVIRLAPPLVISPSDLRWAARQIQNVFKA